MTKDKDERHTASAKDKHIVIVLQNSTNPEYLEKKEKISTTKNLKSSLLNHSGMSPSWKCYGGGGVTREPLVAKEVILQNSETEKTREEQNICKKKKSSNVH